MAKQIVIYKHAKGDGTVCDVYVQEVGGTLRSDKVMEIRIFDKYTGLAAAEKTELDTLAISDVTAADYETETTV